MATRVLLTANMNLIANTMKNQSVVINPDDYIYYEDKRFASKESFEMYLNGTGRKLISFKSNKQFCVSVNRASRGGEQINRSHHSDSMRDEMHEAGHKYSDFG